MAFTWITVVIQELLHASKPNLGRHGVWLCFLDASRLPGCEGDSDLVSFDAKRDVLGCPMQMIQNGYRMLLN